MIVCLFIVFFFSKVNCCISPPLSVTNLFASALIDTTVRKDQTAQTPASVTWLQKSRVAQKNTPNGTNKGTCQHEGGISEHKLRVA